MTPSPGEAYGLPIVTSDTVEGLIGSITGKDHFFRDADDDFHDRQTPLYDVVTQWAQFAGGPDAVKTARSVAAIMHFALSEQAAADTLRPQNPGM
jgi:hypothetical protein